MRIVTEYDFPVTVRDGHTDASLWSGTAAELAAANDYDVEVMNAIATLRRGAADAYVGGGAAPLYRIEVTV